VEQDLLRPFSDIAGAPAPAKPRAHCTAGKTEPEPLPIQGSTWANPAKHRRNRKMYKKSIYNNYLGSHVKVLLIICVIIGALDRSES
jgi:hypothetical protein